MSDLPKIFAGFAARRYKGKRRLIVAGEAQEGLSEYTPTDLVNELIAAAYEDAARVVSRAGHSLDVEIRHRTPDDARAALAARDKRVREEALREAAEVSIDYGKQQYIANVVHQPRYADDIADDAQEIARLILALITKDQTNDQAAC